MTQTEYLWWVSGHTTCWEGGTGCTTGAWTEVGSPTLAVESDTAAEVCMAGD